MSILNNLLQIPKKNRKEFAEKPTRNFQKADELSQKNKAISAKSFASFWKKLENFSAKTKREF